MKMLDCYFMGIERGSCTLREVIYQKFHIWQNNFNEVNIMDDEQMEDGLEALYKELGAKTKNLDGSKHGNILSQIKELQEELFENKIKPSTQGERPDPTTILPQWSASGKKVVTMKINKRRPGSSGNIEPMGL